MIKLLYEFHRGRKLRTHFSLCNLLNFLSKYPVNFNSKITFNLYPYFNDVVKLVIIFFIVLARRLKS